MKSKYITSSLCLSALALALNATLAQAESVVALVEAPEPVLAICSEFAPELIDVKTVECAVDPVIEDAVVTFEKPELTGEEIVEIKTDCEFLVYRPTDPSEVMRTLTDKGEEVVALEGVDATDSPVYLFELASATGAPVGLASGSTTVNTLAMGIDDLPALAQSFPVDTLRITQEKGKVFIGD